MKEKIKWYMGEIICVTIMLVLIGALVLFVADAASAHEVESYSFHAEITHMDSNSYYKKNSGTRTEYVVAVSDGDVHQVFKVSGSYYAEHKEGELVEVECRVMDSLLREEYKEYSLK